MKRRYRQFLPALLVPALGVVSAPDVVQAAASAPDCTPDGALQFVCGPVNAEDLVRIGNSQWLISSGMDGISGGAGAAKGHLTLVDHRAKRWQAAFPGDAAALRLDKTLTPNCPGPLNTGNFSAHGIALKERSRGQYRLYVVGHGEREAIEIFAVDARGSTPAFTWTGCVVLPDDVTANSVAILPDWGFVTTKFLDRKLPQEQAMADLRQGKINGAVFEWHPGGRVAAIPGTELSAPNGIEVSPDGKTIYVTASGSHEFVRFRREGNGVKKDAVPLAIAPDNVRWTTTGKLLTTGSNYAGPTAPRSAGWTIVEVDPGTLQVRKVASGDGSKGMQALSVALEVDAELWVGTFAGDRVGYVKPELYQRRSE